MFFAVLVVPKNSKQPNLKAIMSSNHIYIPYFYIIEHINTGIKYAGSKWAKNSDPKKFMQPDGYCTSSEIIKDIISSEGLKSFRVLEIILEEEIKIPFGWNNIYEYETWFLKSNEVALSREWFNLHENQGNIKFGSKQFSQIIMAKYGVDWPLQAKSAIDKRTITWLEKYGVRWPMQSEIIKAKGRETKLKNHGDQNYNNTHQTKATKLERYGDENYNNNEKNKLTCLEKYGVENPFQSKDIIEKSKQTKIKNHSDENYNNREKAELTCQEKYGESHYAKTEEARLKQSIRAKLQRANEPILTCEHCNKSGKGPTMFRYHFNQCKSKPI
jgi:hypothetical protein